MNSHNLSKISIGKLDNLEGFHHQPLILQIEFINLNRRSSLANDMFDGLFFDI